MDGDPWAQPATELRVTLRINASLPFLFVTALLSCSLLQDDGEPWIQPAAELRVTLTRSNPPFSPSALLNCLNARLASWLIDCLL